MYLIYSYNISSFFNTNPFPPTSALYSLFPFVVANELLHLQPFTNSHFRFIRTVELVTSQTSIQRSQQASVASSDPSALGLQTTQHSARRAEHLLLPLCSVLLGLPSHCLGPARSLTLRLWTGLDAFPWMVSPTGARCTPRRNQHTNYS